MHAWINITHPGFSGRQEMPDDGDQWVSWEQMVATLRAKGEAEGRAALLAREVVELRGEVVDLRVQVANLGAIAERLVPLDFLLHYDPERTTLERMASVIQEQRKTLGRMEGAQIVAEQEGIATRKQLREARKEIADLKRGGVVVPELPAETALALIAIDWPNRTIDVCATAGNIREWFRKSLRTIPSDRALGEGGDICFAPKDRPVLAYWQHHGETFSDVVIWREQSDGFVCHGEHLEHEDDAVGIATIPKSAKWLDLPSALRAQPTQKPTPEGGAK